MEYPPSYQNLNQLKQDPLTCPRDTRIDIPNTEAQRLRLLT